MALEVWSVRPLFASDVVLRRYGERADTWSVGFCRCAMLVGEHRLEMNV